MDIPINRHSRTLPTVLPHADPVLTYTTEGVELFTINIREKCRKGHNLLLMTVNVSSSAEIHGNEKVRNIND